MSDNFTLLNQILKERTPEELLFLSDLLLKQGLLHLAIRCLEHVYQQLGTSPQLEMRLAHAYTKAGMSPLNRQHIESNMQHHSSCA
ncbi:MAG: hypothetical protein ACRC53_12460 [Plesiomonas sp.]|uniref:hypothetical protein n=1 Tax=Plesiomonas sp. TaxID=2486279 RepID=UPI003F3B3FB2